MNPPLFWKSFKKLHLSQSNVNLRSKRWTEEGKPRARQVSQTTCLSLMARVSSGWDFWQNLLQHHHNPMQHLQSLASPHLGFNAELIHLSLWGRYSLLLLCFFDWSSQNAPEGSHQPENQEADTTSSIPLSHPTADSPKDPQFLMGLNSTTECYYAISWTLLSIQNPADGRGHHFYWWNTVWICMSTCHNQKNSSVYWNCSLPPIVALLNVHTQSHL